MVSNIKRDELYTKGPKQHKDHVDLSESLNDQMNVNANENDLRKFKDETKSLPIVEFIALNPDILITIINYLIYKQWPYRKSQFFDRKTGKKVL